MGGPHLTVPCTLSKNGQAVKTKALTDTGANGFGFIDTLFAVDLAKFLGTKAQKLSKAIAVKGYNGDSGNSITHILRLHLTIDGRRQYNLPLLILDLGTHDVILGRKWLANFNVLVDAANHCLLWSEDQKPSYSATKEIKVKRAAIVPKPSASTHQDDADARDKAFSKDEKRRVAGRQAEHVCLLTQKNQLLPVSWKPNGSTQQTDTPKSPSPTSPSSAPKTPKQPGRSSPFSSTNSPSPTAPLYSSAWTASRTRCETRTTYPPPTAPSTRTSSP